jgi:hypothetical protein
MENPTWPPLPLAEWRDTYETLHRCLQVVGKVQLALTPRTNHFWNAAFLPGPRGLVTPPLPCPGGTFAVTMDFVDHEARVRASDGATRSVPFLPRPVAEFHHEFLAVLKAIGVDVSIRDQPVELLNDALPLSTDRLHASYDPEPVERWWAIVAQSAQIFDAFRARFLGKASPVLFWWGTFDLSVSRYSGRRAPAKPGASKVEQEAYSHEVSSVGFWPGDVRHDAPAYYAYTAPAPAGFAEQRVGPEGAYWSSELSEFLLPYDVVRNSEAPRETLLRFCQSTYEAGAKLAGWDRAALERGEAEVAPAVGPTEAGHPP